MKMKNHSCWTWMLAGLLSCTSLARAFDPGEAAGVWHILNFSVPSQLTLLTDPQGVVTNIPEAANFEQSTGSITVLSNGTFSGMVPDPVSGIISAGGQGEVVLHLDGTNGPPTMTFHLNRTADFMTTCGSFGDGYQDLIVALRSPTTLTTNDLAGLWNATALKTPYQLDLNRDSSNRVINIQGLNNFETYGGTLTVNPDGTISGSIQDPFTGAVTSVGSGVVNILVTNGDSSTMPVALFVNASKDVMALVDAAYDTNDNMQEVMIFQKASTTNPVSRLASPWRIVTFDVPQLTQQMNGQGQVIGLNGSDFKAERQSLVAGYDGFFTAQVGGTATGTISPATNGAVTMNVQSQDGAETIGFHLNASETLLTSGRSTGDGWEFLLVTKSAPVPGPAQNFGLVMLPATNGFTLDWAAATNSALQSSSNLTTWNSLSNTIGQHTYTTGISNDGAFYRVSQPVP